MNACEAIPSLRPGRRLLARLTLRLVPGLLLVAASQAALPREDLYRHLPCRLGAAHLLTRPSWSQPPDFGSPPPRETHRRVRFRIDRDRVVCRIHQVFFNAAARAQDALLLIPDPGADARVELSVATPPLPEPLTGRDLDAEQTRLLIQEWSILGGNPSSLTRYPLPSRVHGPIQIRAHGYLKVDYRLELPLAAPPGGLKLLTFAPGAHPDRPLALNALEVDLEAAFRGHCFSPTHRLLPREGGPGRLVLTPAGAEHASTSPFVLLWPPRPGSPGVVTGTDPEGRREALVLVPSQPEARRSGPRAWTLAVDTGGSLRGEPLESLLAEVEQVLGLLRPEDRFDVIPFALDPQPLHRFPVPATRENISRAMDFLRRRRAWGAVNFEAALLTALEVASEAGEGHERAVLLFTDGRPSLGELKASRILAQHRGPRIPVFPVATGSDADYYFLEELARLTGGTGLFERGPADLKELVQLQVHAGPDGKPLRIEAAGQPKVHTGEARLGGPLVLTVPLGEARELRIDGEPLALDGLPDAGGLPHQISQWRLRGQEIWESLVGEGRFPGGADSFRLLGLIPGTPRPQILATLQDGVGPLGRDRVLSLAGLLDRGTFDPVPPGQEATWSDNRFFAHDADGRWIESGWERHTPERIRYGSVRHMEISSMPELTPHLALGRSVGLFLTSTRTALIEPEEVTP